MNDITTNQAPYSTAFDLFQHWCNDGYPDYVTGVWSTDGSSYNLTVGVTNDAAGEAGKKEILNLIEDDTSVTFAPQTFTHDYLMQIQEELLPYFEQDLGLVASGVYDRENHVGVEILTARANEEATLIFIAELQAKYGDAISISYTENYVTLTDELHTNTTTVLIEPLSPSATGTPFSPLLAAGLILIPLLVFGIYFALRRRFVPVLQTNAGGTVAQSSKLSVKQVEEIVKESSLTISKEVDERVMEGIGKVIR
ncbi:MAG: hypothetical protein IKT67_08655 [Lachnospiraceae bacterium]|nr:hypothetical protein [Lachnospiraceae bacterium]